MSAAQQTRALGEVVTITKGRKPSLLDSLASEGSLPYATTDLLRTGVASKFIPADELDGCIVTQAGDPVLIWDGSNAGEIFLGRDAVLASTMARIQPDASVVDPAFCYFFLKTAFVDLNGDTTGSTIPHVSRQTLTGLPIPVMDLPEQRSISAILSAMETAIAIQTQAVEAVGRLKRAVMQELFTRGLRGGEPQDSEMGPIPAQWEVVSMGSLGRIGNGSTPKRNNAAYWTGGTFPWLTSAKMYDRDITTADQFVTDVALRACHLPKVEPGAVLMAITGQGKTLGHVAVLEVPATVSQHVAYVQTDLGRVISGFLRGYLETQYEYLRQVASGGGSTKGALTCAFLRDLPIPLPTTVEEQQEIVDILDAIDAKIDLHRQKKALYEELFESLLHGLMSREIDVTDLDLSTLPTIEAVPA